MNMNFVKRLENLNDKLIPAAIYIVAGIIAAIYSIIYLIFSLTYFRGFMGALSYHWFLASVLLVYGVCVIVIGYFIFYEGFLAVVFFPLVPITTAIFLFWERQVRKYLETNKVVQNVHAPIVVIVTCPDRTSWRGWLKPNVTKKETIALVEYLNAKKRGFSFYLHASFADVESIMRDGDVKEVCFFGHGSSHIFRLSSNQDLHYCDFKDVKYAKELVHQIHCGDKEGRERRLIDYVVPAKDRGTCFWFDKVINEPKIIKELKERTERLKSGKPEV
jgi:hypothetical protein